MKFDLDKVKEDGISLQKNPNRITEKEDFDILDDILMNDT